MRHLLLFTFICFIGISATSQKSKQNSPTLTKQEARQILNQAIKNSSNNAINAFMSLKTHIENDKIIIEMNLSTDEFSTYYIDKNFLTFRLASSKNDKNDSFFLKALAISKYHFVIRYLEDGHYTREITFTPQEINNIYRKNISNLNIDKTALKSLLIKTYEKQVSLNIDNSKIINSHVSIDNGYIIANIYTSYPFWNSIDIEIEKALSITRLVNFFKMFNINKSKYLEMRKFCGIIGEKQIYISPLGETKIINLKYSEIKNFKPTIRQKQAIKENLLEQENTLARSYVDLDGQSIAWVDINNNYLCYHFGFFVNNGELNPIVLKEDFKKSLLETPLETSQLISFYKIVGIKGIKHIYINYNYDTICEVTTPFNEIELAIKNLSKNDN